MGGGGGNECHFLAEKNVGVRGTLRVLQAAPHSRPPPPPPQAASAGLPRAGLNPLALQTTARSVLVMRLPAACPSCFHLGWSGGLPLRPSGKAVLFLEKNDRGRLSIPSQSLHAAGPAVTAPMTQIFAKLWFPQSSTLIPSLLRKICKLRHGRGRQPT